MPCRALYHTESRIPNSESRIQDPELESVLDPELHDALSAAVGRDASELRLAQVGSGVTPVEMVGQVERLDAQLDVARAAQADQPRKRGIECPVARSLDRAIFNVA